jgi:hypothetical protein
MSVDKELQLRHASLETEHRLLRKQITSRVPLTDDDRRALAELGQKLGKQVLEEIATAASGALSLVRVGGSRSDRSCQHRDHPSHRAGRLFLLIGQVKSGSSAGHRSSLGRRPRGAHRDNAVPTLGLALSPVPADRPGGSSTAPRPSGHSCWPPPRPCGCCRDARAGAASTVASVRLAPHLAQRHPCPLDEQLAHIAVATCADAHHVGLPARGMWAWYAPQPGTHWRPCLHALASLTAATRAIALQGPSPGIVLRR